VSPDGEESDYFASPLIYITFRHSSQNLFIVVTKITGFLLFCYLTKHGQPTSKWRWTFWTQLRFKVMSVIHAHSFKTTFTGSPKCPSLMRYVLKA